MLPKRFPDFSFDAVSVYGAGEHPFTCNYSKPSISLNIQSKKNPVAFARDKFGLQNAVKVVFAQQAVLMGKFSSDTRPRVLHVPWHDEP